MSLRAPIFVAIAMLALACTITQNVDPVTAPTDGLVCVVRNPDVRQAFLDAYANAIESHGLQVRKAERGDDLSQCALTSTYRANWSWDLALYMSYAKIDVYRNRQLVGSAEYDSTRGGGNMGKFINAENKIIELTNELFGGASAGS